MSSRFDLIAQAIFQKPFANCSLSELEALAQAHPAFAPAHFLWVKKLQQSGIANPHAAVQKAALYYHQPQFFEAFLHNDEVILAQPQEEPEAAASIALDAPEQVISNVAAAPFSAPVPEPEINAAQEPKTEIVAEPVAEDFAPSEIADAWNEEPLAAAEDPQPEVALAVLTEKSSSIENIAPTEPAPDALVDAESPAEAAPTPQHEALAFEPFHTVDYFASQGIRLQQTEIPKDKFGKQLKSFTEWLKVMKKLPASEQVKSLDPQAEQKVEHLAAHSVEGADVVTETMAEVWIKQGAKEKAAEVYRKLSLLNPSKRAYFAAKIQHLK